MKLAQLRELGDPAEVVECVEGPDPGAPGPGQILVEVAAGPINPAEILLMRGEYASIPPLPAPLGIEGAGTVLSVGDGVGNLAAGDKVMLMPRTCWRERILVEEAQVVKLPADVDLQQASMLKVNPATAWLMLRDYIALKPGDWVIQNTANSGVGTNLVRLAKARGIKTVNVVRREEAASQVRALGGDVALVDGEDLAERVAAETGGAEIRLAIDAVAGEAVIRLAACLGEGGTVVNYGMLSGKACMMTTDQTVFQGKSLTGFWLAKQLGGLDKAGIDALYGELIPYLSDGTIDVAIEAAYPLAEVKQAVAHACREARGGKILIMPNG